MHKTLDKENIRKLTANLVSREVLTEEDSNTFQYIHQKYIS